MALPGYKVNLVTSPPNPTVVRDISTLFAIGKATIAGQGLVFSLDQFAALCGARDPASHLYDGVDVFFREGGQRAYVSAVPLAGVDADLEAAIADFDKGLGPGQLAAFGITSPAVQLAMAAHVLNNDRVAVLDAPDSNVVADLEAAAAAVRGQPGDVFSGMFAPWDIVPGIASGTTRVVPPAARICGNIARNDVNGYGPGDAAAGSLGQALYAQDLSQAAFSEADRTALNGAGINLSRIINGNVRTYGWRSLADQVANEDWSLFTASRVIMAVSYRLGVVAENFAFKKLDGQNITLKKFAGALVGELIPFWQDGDLFGATSGEAFSVDVGPSVNTLQTMANNEIHAKVGLKVSEFGEQVIIDVAKVPITMSLPTA